MTAPRTSTPGDETATQGVTEPATPDAHDADESASEAGRATSRILAWAPTTVDVLAERAQSLLGDHDAQQPADSHDGDQFDREERASLRRVDGLRTELADVTEVEYRQLRLENVVLIGVYSGQTELAEQSLRELAALAETAGARVLAGLLQRRPNPDPATYVGRGKAGELADVVKELGADTVIADSELAPNQRRALEDRVSVKVIDRTAVILDIFSQHAKSREGKAQVELAQLEYLLPRLRGWGESMSRQAGGQVGGQGAGMGSRGPGETKIELDRRRIHSRMARLKRQIKAFAPARKAKRANRDRYEVPGVAIVGYTNAGKSSLLNRITGAGVLVENALFATLDTSVRRAETRDGRVFTIADTVGFVRNLPHQLVEAFRSTLEEASEATVIVHVVDASHPDPAAQLQTVRDVLGEAGARSIPEVVVFNKSDLVEEGARLPLRGLEPHAIFASARTGEGIDAVLHAVGDLLPRPDVPVSLLIPYDRGDVVSELHDRFDVVRETYGEDGTRIDALVTEAEAGRLRDFAVRSDS